MRVKLTGYFKFSPISELDVKVPAKAIGEAMLRFAAGMAVYVDKSSYRDVYNALLGKCAAAGWYKNGGWLPRGYGSCGEKDKGDILGICATLHEYPSTRIWLYCDKEFEQNFSKDFVKPGDLVRHPYTVQNWLLDMKCIPDQGWLNAFCERTHSPDAFSKRRFGRVLSLDEIKACVKKMSKLKEYVKLMWRIRDGEESV